MPLLQARQSIRPPHFLALAALVLLAVSPGVADLVRQVQDNGQNAERARALELANHAIGEAEKLLPEPGPVHTYYPESNQEQKRKAKTMIGAVEELRKADAALSAFLKTHPDDLALLWAQVHIDFLKRQLPIYEAGKEARKPGFLPSAGRDPMKTLDHILEIEPNQPNAYFREAQLFATPHLRGLTTAPDFAKAIESARKAVDRSPEDAEFRETLANFLLEMGRDGEAMDAVQPLEGGRHPAYLLLAAWSKLPLPAGAVLDKCGTQISAQLAAIAGKDNPGLRERVYEVALSVADLESFYRAYWKDFQFSSKGKEEIKNGEHERRFVAYFLWQNEEWHLADPSIAKQADETGLTLWVHENRKDAKPADTAPPVRCVLSITNNRPVSSAKP